MKRSHGLALFSSTLALFAANAASAFAAQPGDPPDGITKIETVVVIFAENRAFDNLYGHFPGADGIDKASQESLQQRDRLVYPQSLWPFSRC